MTIYHLLIVASYHQGLIDPCYTGINFNNRPFLWDQLAHLIKLILMTSDFETILLIQRWRCHSNHNNYLKFSPASRMRSVYRKKETGSIYLITEGYMPEWQCWSHILCTRSETDNNSRKSVQMEGLSSLIITLYAILQVSLIYTRN